MSNNQSIAKSASASASIKSLRRCKIYETLSPVNEMKAQTGNDGLMTLSGVFGVCGVRNNNHRIYETKNYASMVSRLKERIKQDGAIPGELEHPQTMNITTENISHKITDINIDENGKVTGTIKLLNTPKGKIAQAIVEGGLPLFVSSRATGTIDKNGNVTLGNLVTYDLVGSPGFSQARMYLNESTETLESINENMSIIIENNTDMTNDIEEQETGQVSESSLLDEVAELRSEVRAMKEGMKDYTSKLANAIQRWIEEEYEPELMDKVSEQMEDVDSGMSKSDVDELVKSRITEAARNMGDKIQDWIINEYSPNIQGWITKEYTPALENWLNDEYASNIENWLNDEYTPHITENIVAEATDKTKEYVSESNKESKSDKIQEITEMLKVLESSPVEKPSVGKAFINEASVAEPIYIQRMPEDKRPLWNAASAEVKENVNRRARLFDFTSEGAIERFWDKIDLNESAQPKQSQSVYEGLDSIADQRERAIRLALRARRMR